MTTDTAVRVTRKVIQEQCKSSYFIPYVVSEYEKEVITGICIDTLSMIPYVDHPEIKFNEHESTQMPFRYVKDENDKPIMPEVSSTSVVMLRRY